MAHSLQARNRLWLAVWVAAPVVGLGVVYLVANGIAPIECTAAGRPELFAGFSQAFDLAFLLGVAGLFTLLGAATRFFASGRRRVPWLAAALVVLGLLALAATVYADLFAGASPIALLAGVAALGAAAAGLSLAELRGLWAEGRSLDEAGAALPLYLLATGLVLSPAVALLAFVGRAGATC